MTNNELKRLSEEIDNLTEEEISKLKEKYKKEESKSKNQKIYRILIYSSNQSIIKYIIKQLQIYTILTANYLYANVNIRVNSS